MKKTYWWRMITLLVGLVVFGHSYMSTHDSSLCGTFNSCLFRYNAYTDPLLFLSLSLLALSVTVFFVNDSIFLKWLRFTLIWFATATIFIVLSPEYSPGYIGNMMPTKEMVSIWMSILFVLISPIKIIWDSKKARLA